MAQYWKQQLVPVDTLLDWKWMNEWLCIGTKWMKAVDTPLVVFSARLSPCHLCWLKSGSVWGLDELVWFLWSEDSRTARWGRRKWGAWEKRQLVGLSGASPPSEISSGSFSHCWPGAGACLLQRSSLVVLTLSGSKVKNSEEGSGLLNGPRG